MHAVGLDDDGHASLAFLSERVRTLAGVLLERSSMCASAASPSTKSTTWPRTSTLSNGLSRAVMDRPTRGSRRRLRSFTRPTAVLKRMRPFSHVRPNRGDLRRAVFVDRPEEHVVRIFEELARLLAQLGHAGASSRSDSLGRSLRCRRPAEPLADLEPDDGPGGRLAPVLLVLLGQERERALALGVPLEDARLAAQPHPPEARPVLLVVIDQHGRRGCARMFCSRFRRRERFGFSSTAE